MIGGQGIAEQFRADSDLGAAHQWGMVEAHCDGDAGVQAPACHVTRGHSDLHEAEY